MIKKGEFQSAQNPIYSATSLLNEGAAHLLNYNRNIVEMFWNSIDSEKVDLSILEFGAGTGTLAKIFRDAKGIKVKCVEIDPTMNELLKADGFKSVRFVSELREKFNFIYTSNVLEHIENDIESIKQLKKLLLDNNSKLAIYVPSFPILFSDLDKRAGHVRRYRKRELREKLQNCGFHIEELRYNDSIGFFASIALKIFGFQSTLGIGGGGGLWNFMIRRFIQSQYF